MPAAGIVLHRTGMLDEFDLADSESNWPRVSIEPGSALNMEIKLGPFTESEIAHMSREPNRLYVYALIEYNDGFKDGRQREGCWVLNPTSKAWQLCHNHQKAT